MNEFAKEAQAGLPPARKRPARPVSPGSDSATDLDAKSVGCRTGTKARAVVFSALLTPLGDHGRLDRSAAYAHISHLAAAGVDALWACGSCGEGAILSDDCVVDAGAWLMREFGGSLTVVVNAGRASTSGAVQLALRLADVGVKHIAAVCPYYYSLSADQLVGHYECLLAALPQVGIYAYNIPPRTVNDLMPEQVGQLAKRGLAGIKDTTNVLERHCQYLAQIHRSPPPNRPDQPRKAYAGLLGN